MALGFATVTYWKKKRNEISIALILDGDKWQIFAGDQPYSTWLRRFLFIWLKGNTKYYPTGSAVKWRNFTLPYFFSPLLFRSVSEFYFTLAATFNFLCPRKFVVSENLVVIVIVVRELAWHDVNIEISYAPIHKADRLISRTDDFPTNGAEENVCRHGRFVTMKLILKAIE